MQTTSVSSRDRPRLLLVIVLIPLLASCSPDVDNLFGDSSLFAVVPPGCDEVLAGPLGIPGLQEPEIE